MRATCPAYFILLTFIAVQTFCFSIVLRCNINCRGYVLSNEKWQYVNARGEYERIRSWPVLSYCHWILRVGPRKVTRHCDSRYPAGILTGVASSHIPPGPLFTGTLSYFTRSDITSAVESASWNIKINKQQCQNIPLVTHLCLMPRLRIRRASPPQFHGLMLGTRVNLPFHFK
jgi:hypothetical protein